MKCVTNHDLIGLAASSAHSPVVGLLQGVMTPAVKSRFALVIHTLALRNPKILAALGGKVGIAARLDHYVNQLEAGRQALQQSLALTSAGSQ